jgi:nitrile hydratase accessory protein
MSETPDSRIANMDEHIALPRQNGALVFAVPWEARAFGMAVALNEAGMYPWGDFSQGLAAETAMAEHHGESTSYYERWLYTLEKLAIARGLLTPAELDARTTEYARGVHDEHAATSITAPTSLPGTR